MMKIKPLYLSHSQVSTFLECQRKYYLERIEKIRPTYLGSALYFGTAIDDSVEHILLKKEGDYLDTFFDRMNNFQVNKKDKKLPEDILSLKFFVSDLDENLVTQDFMNQVCESLEIEAMEISDFLDYCKSQRKKKKELTEVEQKVFNFLAQRSLEEKGKLILKAVEEWIEENVLEVHSTQKKLELTNDNGDTFIGYSDFTLTLKEHGKLLMDFKTSSNPKQYYPDDSASNSPQLATYSIEEEVDGVAYLVAAKKILKRMLKNEKGELRFVKGEITEEFLEETFLQIEQVTDTIKEKLPSGIKAFSKNKEACGNWGNCQYRNYCWKNGDMKKLEKIT